MIFSPQSAAPVVTEPPKTTAPPPPVIETTPTTTTTTRKRQEIKPSKTVVLPVQPKEKVSIVQVLPETPKPPTVKPIGPLKFVPKAVPKVAIKPILKPKPKIVEVSPVKVEPVPQQEQPQPDRFIVKPVPKSVIIKPVAPVVKVVATKVEPTTTTTESSPEIESEEEQSEEFEQEQEPQEIAEDEPEEVHEEVEEEEEEEEEELKDQQQREVIPIAKVVENVHAVEPVQETEQPKTHVVEAVKPVTAATTTTTTTEEPAAVGATAEDQHEEHSPIMFSNISEMMKPAAEVKDVRNESGTPTVGAVEHQQNEEETPEAETNGDEDEDDEEEEDETNRYQCCRLATTSVNRSTISFRANRPSLWRKRSASSTCDRREPPHSQRRHRPSSSTAREVGQTERGNKGRTHPTGLVTTLGGTVVKEGVTTVHETSVIGTYISGKYAQVLQSTSHVIQGNKVERQRTVTGVQRGQRGHRWSPAQAKPELNVAHPEDGGTGTQQRRHGYSPGGGHRSLQPSQRRQRTRGYGAAAGDLFASQPSSSLVRPSRRLPGSASGNFKNRLKNRISKDENDLQEQGGDSELVTPQATVTPQPTYGKKPGNRYRNTQIVKPVGKNTRYNRYSTSSVEVATVSVYSEPSPTAGSGYQNRRNKSSRNGFKPTSSHSVSTVQQQQQQQDAATRRSFKPKPQPSAPLDQEPGQTTSLYKFKLNRSPGRWQYKSPAKPTVAIRKQSAVKPKDQVLENLTTAPISDTSVQSNDIAQSPEHAEKVDTDADLDQSGSVHGNVLNDAENDNQIERRYPIETLKVEISTPADFRDTYYEIATIKSPYTFQVGTVKNTRYITVTSTIEKVLEQETATITPSLTEPLTENILATTTHIDKESNLLDSSIATLPPIALGIDTETPPLETLTETFSTTQAMLKTHILPVIRDGDTTSYTLIQTYHVTRLVTATKTLPPMELYHFVPSRTLNEFNSRLDEAGSELHLELEFGDDNENDDEDKPKRERLPSDWISRALGLILICRKWTRQISRKHPTEEEDQWKQ
uniref:DUF4758 domain-containing protein n=1 Tax=Anopheles funestus TaxID=62324 RepID=A0A4Y0BCV1_ANOFN